MFLFKKYFYTILLLLAIPISGLTAPINNKYTFEVPEPSIDVNIEVEKPLLINWQIKGNAATLQTLVNENRIARIYLKQKTGKLDRVLKTIGSVTLSDEMIECADEKETDCTLTQEYQWIKVPSISSGNYYIRITLRPNQNIGAFIRAFFLWSKYPYSDSAVFRINRPTEKMSSGSSTTSATSSITTITTLDNNTNQKNTQSLPITPPKVEVPRSIIFANINIPLEAKNYVQKNEDLYPPIYLTPEYYVDKTSTYNNATSRNQTIELISQNGPYLATLYKIIAGESTRQYRQVKFYPDGKYEEIPTQWSVVDSKIVKYYSFLPINTNGFSVEESLTYKNELSQEMISALDDIRPIGSKANSSSVTEDLERKKISPNLYNEILSVLSSAQDTKSFSCDEASIEAISQKLEAARGRMAATCPNECSGVPYCSSHYECNPFNNARDVLQEYKALCNLTENKNAYIELIGAIENNATAQGYEKITSLKRGAYSELLNSYITKDITILGKSITRCTTDINGKCWSSYSVWPNNFTVYPDNISGGTVPLSYLLIPTEYQFGDNELSKHIFPTGSEYFVKFNGQSVYDMIAEMSGEYGNLAEAMVYKNGWGFPVNINSPKGTIDSNGNYQAPKPIEDSIIINTILARTSEGDRRFNVYVLPKEKLTSDLFAPVFNKSFASGNAKYVLGNALHYCDLNIIEPIGNSFGIEQASDYVLYVQNKSDNIIPVIVGYNDYSSGGTSRLVIKWPVSQIGNLTIGSFSVSNNLKVKDLQMFLDSCQKSGACPYTSSSK